MDHDPNYIYLSYRVKGMHLMLSTGKYGSPRLIGIGEQDGS